MLLIALGIVVVILAALFGIAYYFNNRCFNGYEVQSEVERSDSENVKYSYFNGNILKCSRSGISAIDNDGNSLWNGGFEMKQPQVDTCGEYVVVADVTGKNFYVYNGKDEGQSIETALPIVRAKVGAHGVVGVLLEDTDSNVLNLYNPYSSTDSLLVEIPSNVSDEGYPVDFDISPDGNSVVISYVTIEGNEVENKVSFYNFTEVGQDQNMLVGGISFGDEMASDIEFVDDDEVAVFREKGFTLFRKMKQPAKLSEQSFDSTIRSVAYSDQYIGVVTGESEEDKKNFYLFDLKGKEILRRELSFDFSEMKIYNEEVFFISNLNCRILRSRGSEKFVCEFKEGIDTIYPTANGSVYTLLNKDTIQKIRLTKKG